MFRLGLALWLAALGLVLAMTGAGFCLWSLYLYAKVSIGAVAAGLVTGAATLLLALVSTWAAHRMTR